MQARYFLQNIRSGLTITPLFHKLVKTKEMKTQALKELTPIFIPYKTSATNELDLLNEIGAEVIHGDLPFCTEYGAEFFIGYRGRRAYICALLPGKWTGQLLTKPELREMVDTAKIAGIENISIYTNYPLEIHSKEGIETVGLSSAYRIINPS